MDYSSLADCVFLRHAARTGPADPARHTAVAGYMAVRPVPAGLFAARRQVRILARELEMADDDATDLLMAVGEAISNAYRHGTPDPDVNLIYLGWHCADEVLTVTVQDEGPGFVFRQVDAKPQGPCETMGGGIRLMRESMDQVYVEFGDGAKVVLKKFTGSRGVG